eukprot:g5677.t1
MAQSERKAPPYDEQELALSAPPPYHEDEPASGGARVCFWLTAGCAWVVLGLAITASAHDEWVRERVGGATILEYGPGDSKIFDVCDTFEGSFVVDEEFGTVCALYRAFTWVQYIATVMCSIAVAVLTLAAFLPAAVGCCSWVKSLSVIGGVFMIFFVLLQLTAVLLVYFYVEIGEKTTNDEFDSGTFFGDSLEYEYEFRTTFWIAAVGLVLGLFTSVGERIFVEGGDSGGGGDGGSDGDMDEQKRANAKLPSASPPPKSMEELTAEKSAAAAFAANGAKAARATKEPEEEPAAALKEEAAPTPAVGKSAPEVTPPVAAAVLEEKKAVATPAVSEMATPAAPKAAAASTPKVAKPVVPDQKAAAPSAVSAASTPVPEVSKAAVPEAAAASTPKAAQPSAPASEVAPSSPVATKDKAKATTTATASAEIKSQ